MCHVRTPKCCLAMICLSIVFPSNNRDCRAQETQRSITFKFVRQDRGAGKEVNEAVSADGKFVLKLAGEKYANKTARLFDTATSKPLGPAIELNGRRITALAISPNGKLFATAFGNYNTDSGKVTVWNPTSGEKVSAYRGPPYLGEVLDIRFSGDGQVLIITGHSAADG